MYWGNGISIPPLVLVPYSLVRLKTNVAKCQCYVLKVGEYSVAEGAYVKYEYVCIHI